jgi:hypothetical protein
MPRTPTTKPAPLPKPIQAALEAYAYRYYINDQGTGDEPAKADRAWGAAEAKLRAWVRRNAVRAKAPAVEARPVVDPDLFWQLLRAFECNLGKQAGPCDTALIRGCYRHLSKVTGKTLTPEWIGDGSTDHRTVFDR